MSNLDRTTTATGTGVNIEVPPPVVQKTAVPVAGVPVAPVAPVEVAIEGLQLEEKVVHGPEKVIQHPPLVEKEVLQEPALEVRREHHIQPIIHEREHRVQPIIKTEVTAEQPIIVQDKTVMHAPIVEPAPVPAGLEAVEQAGPEAVIHRPKLEKEVIVERPVEVRHEHHVQPIIHEREHHIQPIVKTEVTAEQVLIEKEHEVVLPPIVEPAVVVGAPVAPVVPAPVAPVAPAAPVVPGVTATTILPRDAGIAPSTTALPEVAAIPPAAAPLAGTAGMLDTEDRLPSAPGIVAPLMPGEREVLAGGPSTTGTTAGTTGTGKATIGQKIKGAVKEVAGTITRNPAKKEEGKMLMHGIDPGTSGVNRPL